MSCRFDTTILCVLNVCSTTSWPAACYFCPYQDLWIGSRVPVHYDTEETAGSDGKWPVGVKKKMIQCNATTVYVGPNVDGLLL